jgi:hypothetical protein
LRNAVLAVFAVFPENYQRRLAFLPQKPWVSGAVETARTAASLAVFLLFFAVSGDLAIIPITRC